MDLIKISQVQDVTLIRLGTLSKGHLHLTTHHMIFRDSHSSREIWLCYPMIFEAERRPYAPLFGHSCIRIRCRDFTFLALDIASEQDSVAVFESIMKLTCINNIDRLYAFMYKPGSLEKVHNGWTLYDPVKEFMRMGSFAHKKWRVTTVNKDYTFSPSYPAVLVVPEHISDNVLNYAHKFRSKSRIPALTYYHKFNDCTITRCSQPMVGLKQTRSVQDEKSVMAIFQTTQTQDTVGASQENLIVDARPTTNAMAQTAFGAGSENMENYKSAKKIYLGIDNIHVMRESLNRVVEALRHGDLSPLPPSLEALHKSNWMKHISIILDGSVTIAHQVHYRFSHVLIHCSDGWDRTSQLSSLAQIMLDPYFRTLQGFMVLVEKDWLSFGHRFAERTGFLLNEKHFIQVNETNNQAQQMFNTVSNRLSKQTATKYTSPIFHQFLDCVYQIIRQFPDRFEFNERFLRRLLYHVYSGQYGTFLFNSERERVEAKAAKRTRSAWDYFLARRPQFTNPEYVAGREGDSSASEQDILLTLNTKDVKWWPELFGRTDEEMNPDRLYVNDLKGDSEARIGSPRYGSPRYGSSGTATPGGGTSPMVVPNRPTSQPVHLDLVSDGLRRRDVDSKSPVFPVSNFHSSRDNSIERTEQIARQAAEHADASRNSSVEPLGNTLVTYDHDQDAVDLSRLNLKFDSMALDMDYSERAKAK